MPVLRGTCMLVKLFSESLNVASAEVTLIVFATPSLLEFGEQLFCPHSILARSTLVDQVLAGLRGDQLGPPFGCWLAKPRKDFLRLECIA